ncbi:MAG: 4-diphosphocytidyl-2-C-methyl-D-erythritol kinase [Devosia sp.]|uniref:4-(cytidine 5'-diphospho)-2-C-methyl-D-erythritol kinase n=1 Tax=Devosia sp. TaxID=1871048 RepID=UPI002632D1C9|nr:4-(cytidine 5'-diphospho)-2-C-methyl-D-erythritol kinase [Devosia sp.]MDB5540662.1 4-diphosphocytidyl-2-C-methyl-D-erythritol kinase [Devosia sp.]
MAAALQPAYTEAAPAKVNLALHITGRRPDGYHELESLVVFVDVADEVTARPAKADRFRVTGPFAAAAGNGDSNLVMRAVKAFRKRWPDRLPDGLDIALTKNLPVAAGIGGGSADAAAMLRLLAAIGEGEFRLAELRTLALSLGADVPACLMSRPCEVRGVGEIVHALQSFPDTHLVLVNPLIPVVTADVFRRLELRDNPPMPALPQPLTRPAQLGLWLAETRNDLEAPAIALVPAIGDLLHHMRVLDGCALARMSGSGGTVFGLFGSTTQAHQAAHEMRAKYPQYWVAAAPVIG